VNKNDIIKVQYKRDIWSRDCASTHLY